LVELSARVHPQVPTVPGPVSGEPRAWCSVQILEEVKVGKSTSTNPVLTLASSPGVAVVDESGMGMLELQNAEFDFQTIGYAFKGGASDPIANRVRAFGSLRPSPGHVRFIALERYLMPGEELYMLGHVNRYRNAQGESMYRSLATTPYIQGTSEAKVFVHAGSERSILRGLQREKTVATVMVAATAMVGMAAAGIELWLVSR
jgi:hypothetical protein